MIYAESARRLWLHGPGLLHRQAAYALMDETTAMLRQGMMNRQTIEGHHTLLRSGLEGVAAEACRVTQSMGNAITLVAKHRPLA